MRIFDRRRHASPEGYVAYQEEVTSGHLLPQFKKLGVPLDRPILDVGCGRGGCCIALAAALDVPVVGIDISKKDIETARKSAAEVGVKAEFEVVNLLEDPLPDRKFGLILMRDVVEHLPMLETVLSRLHAPMDDRGFLYITFPPWRGPYAGHQHNSTTPLRFMPYLHALAPSLFLKLAERWEKVKPPSWIEDEKQICTNRLTRKKFEKASRGAGFRVEYLQTYFLRPAFMRMGLPRVANGFVGTHPAIGESLTTACEYLLVHHQSQHSVNPAPVEKARGERTATAPKRKAG